MSSSGSGCERESQHTRDRPRLRIQVSNLVFTARLEAEAAPRTCEAFERLLPLSTKVLHCCWSGEGVWIPLGRWDLPWRIENPLGRPGPGQLLLYGSGPSEPELLIPYGECAFSSKFGRLTGNHFLTILDAKSQLAKLGHLVLWHGAQECRIERLAEE
jgi:hypothetical protein